MEPRKKRKVETGPPAPPMSAFALRKRMLEQREAAARDAQAAIDEAAAAAQTGQADELQDEQPETAEMWSSSRIQTQKEAQHAQSEEVVNTPLAAAVEQKPVKLPVAQAKSNVPARPASALRQEAPVLRSSFQPNKQNFQQKTNGTMLLKLAEEDRLVILGSYGLTVKSGEVTLAGASLRASEKTHWVHAPRCHALPVIRCSDDATIMLQLHPGAPSLQQLGKLSPMFSRLWNEPPAEASTKDANATFQILYTPEDDPVSSRDLIAPPEWNKLISELMTAKKSGSKFGQPSLFVCGPKSSGKSTFSRLLANRLLTIEAADGGRRPKKWTSPSVAVLDIDPGQPEFGTPGSLSLVHVHEPNFSPPFCHPHVSNVGSNSSGNKLLRAHELASVSPATDPEHYIECVLDLYSLYHRDLRNRYPLVVNTPGWIQGTGLNILTELVKRMQPSQVIYMSQEGPEDAVVGLRSAYQGVPLVELPSQPGELRLRTAAHLRTMQTMSYIHLDLDSAYLSKPPPPKTTSSAYFNWQTAPLTAIRPWVVPYTGQESGILGIMCYDSQPPSDLLADAVNGTVISIVAIESTTAFRTDRKGLNGHDAAMEVDSDEEAATDDNAPRPATNVLPPLVRTPEGIPYILNPDDSKLDPRHSRKLGVALVRGIDVKNRELHLLAPLPAGEAIDEVIRQDGLGVVLIAGKFDSPTWAYTEDLFYRSASKDGQENGKEKEDGDKVTDEDTDEDEVEASDNDAASGAAYAPFPGARESRKLLPSEIPWVETLQGGQRRDVGSRVWRVRRDLGRNTGGAGGGSGGGD